MKSIEANNKKWIKKKKFKFDKKTIIVENFINHPSYTVTNAITALFLNQYISCAGFVIYLKVHRFVY